MTDEPRAATSKMGKRGFAAPPALIVLASKGLGLAVDMRHPQSGWKTSRSVRHHGCRTLSALKRSPVPNRRIQLGNAPTTRREQSPGGPFAAWGETRR